MMSVLTSNEKAKKHTVTTQPQFGTEILRQYFGIYLNYLVEVT